MTEQRSFYVRRADWAADGSQLAEIRRVVFVLEQQVSEAEEWDGLDIACRHVIAYADDGMAIGTGRLVPDVHGVRIGRMAVLQPWRGCGVGRALLLALIEMAREAGHAQINLHAQTHALAFYRKQGFSPVGEEFLEAGIPHYEMRLHLKR